MVIKCLGIITGLIVARYLGPSGRGDWARVLYLPGLIGHISTLGLDTYYSRGEIRNDVKNKAELLPINIIYAIILGILSIACLGLVLRFYNPETLNAVSLPLLIVSLGIPFSIMNILLFSVELGYGNTGNYNGGRVSFSIFYFLGIIALLVFKSFTLDNIAVVYFLGACIAAFSSIYLSETTLNWSLFTYKKVLVLLKKAIPYGISTNTYYIISQLPAGLMVILASSEDLGFFTIALTVSTLHLLFGNAIGKTLLSKHYTNKAYDTNIRVLRITLYINVLIIPIMMLIAPLLIFFMYGQAFKFSGELALYLIPYSIFFSFNNTIDEYLKSMNIWKVGLYINLIFILLTAGIGFILIKYYTIINFITALIIIEIVKFFLLLFGLSRQVNLPIHKLVLIQFSDYKLIKNKIQQIYGHI